MIFFRRELLQNYAYIVSKKYIFARYLILFFLGSGYGLSFNFSYLFWIGWIGVIPLYLFVKNSTWQRAFESGLVWGYGWAIVSFFWLGKIEHFIPYAMSLILALFPAFWALAVPLIRRSLLVPNNILLLGCNQSRKYLIENKLHFKVIFLVLILSAWWCILEWIRSWVFTGLPWNYLAVTQWQIPPIIQVASFTGIYGVSFVLIFFNLGMAETLLVLCNSLLYRIRFYRPMVFYVSILVAVLNLLIGSLLVKSCAISDKTSCSALKALLIQGDIPQIRFYSADEARGALDVYSKYSDEMLSLNPDVLIWPESAVPQALRGGGDLSYEYREKLASLLKRYQVPMLLGTIDYGEVKPSGEYKAYNSALYINKDGKVVDVYNKIHIVPWGEYTPGENIFPLKYIYPWIKEKFGMGRSLSPGREHTIFNLKENIHAGVLICFEDAFPYVARGHILNGANLLVTLTNDAWFPGSYEPVQHLAQAVFRCVENRRTMIRSGNNNGTCVISSFGIITDSIFSKQIGERRTLLPEKQGRGAVLFDVKISTSTKLSFYSQYGDIFIDILGVLFISVLTFSFWKWKDRKSVLLEPFKETLCS